MKVQTATSDSGGRPVDGDGGRCIRWRCRRASLRSRVRSVAGCSTETERHRRPRPDGHPLLTGGEQIFAAHELGIRVETGELQSRLSPMELDNRSSRTNLV